MGKYAWIQRVFRFDCAIRDTRETRCCCWDFFFFQITQFHMRWLSRGDRTKHSSELDDSVPVPAQPSKRCVNLWSYLGWYVNCLTQRVPRVTVRRRHQRSKAVWAVILLNFKDIRNNEVKWKSILYPISGTLWQYQPCSHVNRKRKGNRHNSRMTFNLVLKSDRNYHHLKEPWEELLSIGIDS